MNSDLLKYLTEEGIGTSPIKSEIKDMQESGKTFASIPVCVLSHMYDKRRSKFIANLVNEVRDRQYRIYTYEDQKHLYSQFETLNNVEVVYIPLDNKLYLSLTGKRQYINEDVLRRGEDHAYFIEDDCFNFHLPVGCIGANGNFRNSKFMLSYSSMFSFWEFLIKKYDLTYSGGANNMEFTFRNLDENLFIKPNAQVIQAIQINVKYAYERGIEYDHDSGWDDYDMILQHITKGKSTQLIMFGYLTPALKSGVSAMSSTLESLQARCVVNTNKLIDKWGLSLVRIDSKKGLYNAKINWMTVRSAIKNKINTSKLIGMTNESSKAYIKFTSQTSSNSAQFPEFI